MDSSGLIHIPCVADVLAVWRAYLGALSDSDMSVFATIDHRQNALDASMNLPETKVIIFGLPGICVPLIRQAPTIALDLPLKVLIRETESGAEVVYLAPKELARRHGIPSGNEYIAMIDELLTRLVKEACATAVSNI